MRVVVAGSAGGTGTTTVAALLAALVGRAGGLAPVLVDHGGGTLAARCGGDGPRTGRTVQIADIGALTVATRWETFVADGQVPVLTASMTPSGIAVLAEAVDTLVAHAPGALSRSLLVATGAGAGDGDWLALGRGAASRTARYVLPRDRALAYGGALQLAALSAGTRRRADLLADEVAARLTRL